MSPNKTLLEYSKNSPIIGRQVMFGASDSCSKIKSRYSLVLAILRLSDRVSYYVLKFTDFAFSRIA